MYRLILYHMPATFILLHIQVYFFKNKDEEKMEPIINNHITKANKIADFLLLFCNEHGDLLTNLKLQKLIYYSQAWHIALYKKLLFKEPIEAWVHGPVVYDVYSRFKSCGYAPINVKPKNPQFDKKTNNHLIEVFSVYGSYSAWELEKMTHSEEPWQKARSGLVPDEASRNIISIEDMDSFYSKLAKE
jgi:uncharacterized phage-associated protein